MKRYVFQSVGPAHDLRPAAAEEPEAEHGACEALPNGAGGAGILP